MLLLADGAGVATAAKLIELGASRDVALRRFEEAGVYQRGKIESKNSGTKCTYHIVFFRLCETYTNTHTDTH